MCGKYDFRKILASYPEIKQMYGLQDDECAEFIKKGVLYCYMSHVIYYNLLAQCRDYAQEMLKEIKKIPNSAKKIMELFEKEGYSVRDFVRITNISKRYFYADDERVTTMLKHLYTFYVVGKKYATLCLENRVLRDCGSNFKVSVRKILF